MREYYTHDELNFIETLARGKSFVKSGPKSIDPIDSLRKYALLVENGFRRFDPGLDDKKIRSSLRKILAAKIS